MSLLLTQSGDEFVAQSGEPMVTQSDVGDFLPSSPERTWTIPAEDRTWRIAAESRVWTIP